MEEGKREKRKFLLIRFSHEYPFRYSVSDRRGECKPLFRVSIHVIEWMRRTGEKRVSVLCTDHVSVVPLPPFPREQQPVRNFHRTREKRYRKRGKKMEESGNPYPAAPFTRSGHVYRLKRIFALFRRFGQRGGMKWSRLNGRRISDGRLHVTSSGEEKKSQTEMFECRAVDRSQSQLRRLGLKRKSTSLLYLIPGLTFIAALLLFG